MLVAIAILFSIGIGYVGSYTQAGQEKVNALFSTYGAFVARNPCRVLWASLLFFAILTSGNILMRSANADELIEALSTRNNWALENSRTKREAMSISNGLI